MLPVAALVVSIAQAACGAAWTRATVIDEVAAAELAFSRLDTVAFAAHVSEADARLACLAEPLDPPTAARVHRLRGLGAFVARDSERARRAFASALRADPTIAPPGAGLPEGHPVRALWASADPSDCPGAEGTADLWDGRADGPACRPGLAQWGDPVRVTAWLDVGDALPALPEFPAPPPPPPLVAATPRSLPAPRVVPPPESNALTFALSAGAGVGLLAAGGFYAGALTSAEAFRTERHSAEELVALRDRANGLGTAAVAALGIGAASGALALVTVKW